MSSLGIVTAVLASDVADNATVAVPYPTGQTAQTLAGSTGGDLTIGDGAYGAWEQADPGFSVSYGASTITITNLSGLTWPAGQTLRLSLGTVPRAGSYNLGIGNAPDQAASGAPASVELTASAAVAAGVANLRLNHATVVIAATIADAADHAGFFAVTDTSASGTAAHTVTLTNGTWDGTHQIATLNAPAEGLLVFFDPDGNGTIILNSGSVALT